MRLPKSVLSIFCLVLIAGVGLVMSGCATCGDDGCGGTPKAPVRSGMLHGAMGCDDCDKDSSPLHIEKEMPQQIVVGKPYTYTIKVINASGCGLDDVDITERMPDGYEMSTAVPEPTKVSGRVANWAFGYLAPKETKLITITGIAKAAGATTACTKGAYTPLLCLSPEAISPSLKLALEGPGQALLCDGISAKVTITNTGSGYASGASISLSLPEGLTTADGKSSVSINVGDLAGGESKNYNLNLKATKAGSYTLKANAAAGSELSAASNSISISVKQPNLKIDIEGPGKIFVTKNASYKVVVDNTGNAASAKTVVTASVPAGMQFVKASGGGSMDRGVVTWDIGTLEAGKSASLDATFKAVTGGAGQSSASAKGYCCQEVSSLAKTEVEGISALLLEVVDVEDPIQLGGNEKYLVTVTNQGSAPDTNIVVKVGFEEQFDYVSSKGPTKAVVEEAKVVEFAPLASLGAGQKATWELVAQSKAEGDHRISVKMTSDVLSRSVDETESTHVY